MYQNIPYDYNAVRNEMNGYGFGHQFMPCPYADTATRMDNTEMMMQPPHHNLIMTVQHCEEVCEHMIHMLMHKHDVNTRVKQLNLLRDCADICTLMAKYLSRMSDFSKSTASLCAAICESCGLECAKFSDQESQHCAEICMHCARECRNFAMSM